MRSTEGNKAMAEKQNTDNRQASPNEGGSTHEHYAGGIAQYGNGDFARQGVDTTAVGVSGGGNIVGTDLELLSDEELEARGIILSPAYKAQRAAQRQAGGEDA